jgi:hypothetical protein
MALLYMWLQYALDFDGPAYPRMGVNLRMFDPELWHTLPHRLFDGASY